MTDQDKKNRPIEPKYLDAEADEIWRYVAEVLGNEQLLSELGFASSRSVGDAIVVLLAGDRLHPNKGVDYLGSGWRTLDDDKLDSQIAERENATNAILSDVITALKDDGYDAACSRANASNHQVVYLSRTKQGTRDQLQVLADTGVYVGDFQDHLIDKAANQLVLCFQESNSFFMGDVV